jgi:hypothetical protein
MTLERCDTFIHQLAKISGRGVPEWLERQRGQLQDAMIDCHMWLQGRRMAIAAEGDLLAAWCDFANSQGMQPGPLVAPTSHPSLRQLPVERVVPGIWRICKPCCAPIPPTCWWPTRTPATWRSSLRCRWCARVFRL